MGLDSVEYFMMVEDEFGIEIPDKEAARIETVGEMEDYLGKRLLNESHKVIAHRHRQLLVKLLGLKGDKANIKREQHFSRDLHFD